MRTCAENVKWSSNGNRYCVISNCESKIYSTEENHMNANIIHPNRVICVEFQGDDHIITSKIKLKNLKMKRL